MTPSHVTPALAPTATAYPQGWSKGEAELILLLVDFVLYWLPFLLMLTMTMALCTRRLPGRLLTLGPLRRSRRMRKRIKVIRETLHREGVEWTAAQDVLTTKLAALTRWNVGRRVLFGSAILPAGVVFFGAVGGWGGKLLPFPAGFGAGALALSGGAAAVEAWSLRRGDPYGDATLRGVLALEALMPEHCMESRLGSAKQARNDRRAPASFPVDWTFRLVEEFCESLERLGNYAVRSRDHLARARRVDEVRVFIGHMQEALERYRSAADANSAADGDHEELVATEREARTHLLTSLSNLVTHLSQDRLALPSLAPEDLPDARKNAPTARRRRQTIWQAAVVAFTLSVIAVLGGWAGIPGEFAAPVLAAFGGLAAVLLPRARWPQ